MHRYIYNYQGEALPDSRFHRPATIIKDYGKIPFVADIEDLTKRNNTFRTAVWTGNFLQMTLMSIGVGEDIGWEMHPDVDQFIRIEQGRGVIAMGKARGAVDFQENVEDDDAIIIPAGMWHNLTNTGREPLKLYSIYAPPNHPFGTVHRTKSDALTEHDRYSLWKWNNAK
ncbi:MAG TPA: cupin domain-containing protein [Acholeplasmataceae bacterium]|jgi:mannose-6-phosphate isomerase-like protein (cupin superfamily)|nr:cupin domain-containing protein [Acholeplasmataceae bacterium]